MAQNGIEISTGMPSITIDAALLAYKGLSVKDWDTLFEPPLDPTKPVPPQGYLTINGCVIQKFRNPTGYAYSSATSSQLKTGYRKTYRFDTRLLDSPPPYFPCIFSARQEGWREKPPVRVGAY